MNPASLKLFQIAMEHVTPKDLQEFCPESPRKTAYVQDFAGILSARSVPEVYSFNLTETIGLTQWTEPDQEGDPERFRRFRVFANAVGAAMCSGDKGPDDNLPPNYLAISLLDDLWALQDESLLKLLPAVFSEMHLRVVTARWCADDAPFLILGQLLLALYGCHSVDPASLVHPLVEAERPCARRKGKGVFLWGGTVFNQMHDPWRDHLERAFHGWAIPLEPPLRWLYEGLTGVEDPRTLSLA